jgi:hypothetical protein
LTAGTEAAIERVKGLAKTDESAYPPGTAFVAADLPDFDKIFLRYAAERRPVVIIFPTGQETYYEPGRQAFPVTRPTLGTGFKNRLFRRTGVRRRRRRV